MTQEQNQLFDNIRKYLDNLSNRTGEILTEYHWRECCELIKQIDDTRKHTS